ncbi:hypothetical protein PTTG_30270 [Puccinia triticina 1-1 BBBD Race 1]|uniref:Uncharacterized protein n=1 Tax=Puccinia triticina (isolate 1-1 / race 1 (BBBD)) TaxID=630390 RepID=A0A180FZD8_PUCT1|nr:hypothetical protein PTTG_30270 [Puccinia triticina 1-1 BBBD Race 1]
MLEVQHANLAGDYTRRCRLALIWTIEPCQQTSIFPEYSTNTATVAFTSKPFTTTAYICSNTPLSSNQTVCRPNPPYSLETAPTVTTPAQLVTLTRSQKPSPSATTSHDPNNSARNHQSKRGFMSHLPSVLRLLPRPGSRTPRNNHLSPNHLKTKSQRGQPSTQYSQLYKATRDLPTPAFKPQTTTHCKTATPSSARPQPDCISLTLIVANRRPLSPSNPATYIAEPISQQSI